MLLLCLAFEKAQCRAHYLTGIRIEARFDSAGYEVIQLGR